MGGVDVPDVMCSTCAGVRGERGREDISAIICQWDANCNWDCLN